MEREANSEYERRAMMELDRPLGVFVAASNQPMNAKSGSERRKHHQNDPADNETQRADNVVARNEPPARVGFGAPENGGKSSDHEQVH